MTAEPTDDPDEKPKSRWLYRLCVTLGVIGTMIGLCSGLFLLSVNHTRNVTARLAAQGQMAQLGSATYSYQVAHLTMPGPYYHDSGTRTDLPAEADRLSWRVALLPYIEEHVLSERFDRTAAYNSAANWPHANTFVKPYADPLDGRTTQTPFRVFYDQGALWDSDPKSRIGLNAIPDGSANTVLFVESTQQVPWAQFNEHRYDPAGPLPDLGRASRNSFLAAMADGSVRVVKKTVSPNTLRAIITRDAGDAPGPDW